MEIEDYDADRSLRALRHERNLDFNWTNPRMQHAVQVTIPLRSGGGSNQCSGILVGPDLVLTATHCLKETAFLSDQCVYTLAPGSRRGRVTFDQQLIQDELLFDLEDLTAPPARFNRSPTRVGIASVAAHVPARTGLTPDPDLVRCRTGNNQRQFDGVVLRLDRPVPRGFTRVRSALPQAGELLPVLHHVSESAPKRFSAVRVVEGEIGMPNVIFGSRLDLLAELHAPPIQCGSSGAPLYDEEGYVIGLVSGAAIGPGADCTSPGDATLFFSNLASVLAELNAEVVSAASEVSGFALASFAVAPFTGLQLERSSFGPRAEVPRAVVERTSTNNESTVVVGGFASTDSGGHVLALTGYDSTGHLDPTFGSGGSIEHDIANSANEELFDLAMTTFRSERVVVGVGKMSGPDTILVAQFTPQGQLSSDFGALSPGITRIDPTVAPNGGSSGAAIAIAQDASIFVAGSVSVELRDSTGASLGFHESPVVARLDSLGRPDTRCVASRSPSSRPGTFVWRPEGSLNVLTAESLEQLDDVQSADSYDMVVTDMALDAAGGMILVGYLHQGLGHGRYGWVGRLNPDCSPDTTFGGSSTGVRVLSAPEFAAFDVDAPDNSWLDGVVVEPTTGRIYIAGTAATFDSERGFFAGQMFVMALRSDGSLEDRFTGGPDYFVGALIPREGWHEVAEGIALAPTGPTTRPRVVVVGMTYMDTGAATTRQVRVAAVSDTGVVSLVDSLPPEGAVPGLVDSWATDVAALVDGRVVLSVAHRSAP